MKAQALATPFAVALSACTSHQQTPTPLHATIVAAVEENCDKPGVRIDGIKQLARNREIRDTDNDGLVDLERGRYEIAVACHNPFDEQKKQCTFWGHPDAYPTYRLLLKAGTLYSSRCFVEDADVSYRISKSDIPHHGAGVHD